MGLRLQINRFFNNLEWRLSLILTLGGIVTSIALPAWAVRATNAFEAYAPFSWVAAGFVGFLLFAIGLSLIAHARAKWIRAKYDNNLYARTGFVDPMAATFENKRIFLADFVLPSDPHIDGKTFINCEIVGPSNLFIRINNRVDEHRLPVCDAVIVDNSVPIYGTTILDNCTFRKCSFKRITIFVLPEMYEASKNIEWLNWINAHFERQMLIPGLQPMSEEQTLPQSTPSAAT